MTRRPQIRQAIAIGFSITTFSIFVWMTMKSNRAFLLQGLDGAYMSELIFQQRTWHPTLLGLSSNFFQSLGSVWFPHNMVWEPAYHFATNFSNHTLNAPAVYFVFSLEVLLATVGLGLASGLSVMSALVTGMGLVLCVFPCFGAPLLRGAITLTPQIEGDLASTALCLAIMWRLGRLKPFWNCLCILALFGLLTHLALSQIAAFAALVAPILTLFLGCRLFFCESTRERAWILGGALIATVVFVFLGLPQYTAGLFRYTAVNFFPHDFTEGRRTWGDVSMLFDTRGAFGPALWMLAVLGAVDRWQARNRLSRALSASFFLTVLCLLALGGTVVTRDTWRGPLPGYYEEILWPVYAVLAAFAIQRLKLVTTDVFHFAPRTFWMGLTVATLLCGKLAAPSVDLLGYVYPPRTTPIIEHLKEKLGVLPGGDFKGRVATVVGSTLPTPANWMQVHGLDNEITAATGNDHRMVGLWHHQIPTLVEYSPFISPMLFLWSKEFFTPNGDEQTRNILMIRKVEPRLMAAIGVRFVITDHPLTVGKEILRIPGAATLPLMLYELQDSNTGNYAPTEAIGFTTLAHAVRQLRSAKFDPRQQVIAHISIPNQLSKLQKSSVHLHPGALRIQASSLGTSLLLLPFEFSHCLRLDGGPQSPQLLRANLLQTAILFSGELEATLSYFTGFEKNAGCRLKDADDMARMGISTETTALMDAPHALANANHPR